MNRLNKTEAAVFLYYRLSLFLKGLIFQIILCSFGINFKLWGSETAAELVLINILRENLDS